jgi:hypothetical protein
MLMENDIVESVADGRQNGKRLYSTTVKNHFIFVALFVEDPRRTISRRAAKKMAGPQCKKISIPFAVKINSLNPSLCGRFSETSL